MSLLIDKTSAEGHLGTMRCAFTMLQALDRIANGELSDEERRACAADALAKVAPSGIEPSLKACEITIDMLEKTIAGDETGAMLAGMRLMGLVAELTESAENHTLLQQLDTVL